MTAKKTEEVVPEGSVQIESFHHLEGFDPTYGIPEIATWRDAVADEKPAKAEKAAAPAKSKES
jgi:hypothetical protein